MLVLKFRPFLPSFRPSFIDNDISKSKSPSPTLKGGTTNVPKSVTRGNSNNNATIPEMQYK